MQTRFALTALAAMAVSAVLTSCGSSEPAEQAAEASSTAPATSTTELPPLPAEQPHPNAVGVSPGGVTTRVDVPSDATESGFGQACRSAKEWMTNRQGEPRVIVESYLQFLQQPGSVNPGTFNTAWPELTPGQQAGVILAANMAANDECG